MSARGVVVLPPSPALRSPDIRNKVSRYPRLFPRASRRRARREGTMPTLPLTERAAMARRVAGSRVSSVLSGVRPGQRAGVAVRSAATIPARTSGGRLAHDATRRARSASGGAWPPPAFGRDVGGTGPPGWPPVRARPALRFGPGAARAAPGAARCSESAYSPGDSAGAWGFDSPRLHSPKMRSPAHPRALPRNHRTFSHWPRRSFGARARPFASIPLRAAPLCAPLPLRPPVRSRGRRVRQGCCWRRAARSR
jgi:hypothetical protein